jgi:hypothetical protein
MLINGAAVMEGLEMDEFIVNIAKGIILLGTLNSFSPRFFFFFDPALLGFSSKSVEMLQDSS